MAQQGSIFSIDIDPQAVLNALRRAELPVEVTGPDEDWRRLIIHPRNNGTNEQSLVLRLKTRQTDSLYFRKQLPAMSTHIRRLGAGVPDRQQEMTKLVPRLGTCIGMTATPKFSDQPDFLEAITLVARTIDGMFFVPAGFLDAESRPLLMEDGTFDPAARVPVVPRDDEDEIIELDEHLELQMPNARRVAERMFVMLVLACRGWIESTGTPEEDRERKFKQLADWFWSLEIGHELEDHERAVLDTPLGGLSPKEVLSLIAKFDDVAVLAWALRLAEMPAHDCFFERRKLSEAIGLYSEDAHFVIDSADLRDAIDLRAQADRILAVHWRLREWELRPSHLDFAKLASDTWFGPIELTTLPLKNGDLAFNDRPISKVDPALIDRCTTAIAHRHRAINWLCGHHPVYSQVQTAT